MSHGILTPGIRLAYPSHVSYPCDMQTAGIYRQVIGHNPSNSWWRSPFAWALLSGLLIWAAFPPVGIAFLAWLSPVPLCWLARRPALNGRWPWLQIWMGAFAGWLPLLEGVRRAHAANNLGWVALCLYLAAYVPAFIAIVRIAVHRVRVPLILAAPVTWTALEVIRGRFLTGFAVALLGHTQFEYPAIMQIADLFGAYGVGFVMVFVAAGITESLPSDNRPMSLRPLGVAALGLLAMFAYGLYRIDSAPAAKTPAIRVALLQGTRDKLFEHNPEGDQQAFEEYWRLMLRAKDQRPDLDLIVWPEAAFTSVGPELIPQGAVKAPAEFGMSDEEFSQRVEKAREMFYERVKVAAQRVNRTWRKGAMNSDETYLLVGAESVELEGDVRRQYNGVLLIDPQGELVDRYYKIHPVMFGEYIPLGDWFPWLYKLTPMAQGLSRGTAPSQFAVKGLSLSPSVCFEVTVPHLMRRGQFPSGEGAAVPDILVNVTDDGWFWGSTVLDLQLACGVFRAIELRRPMLIAANTGISAWIDGSGRILDRGPKRQADILYSDVVLDGRNSLYCIWGDIPAWLCVAISGAWIVVGRRRRSAEATI